MVFTIRATGLPKALKERAPSADPVRNCLLEILLSLSLFAGRLLPSSDMMHAPDCSRSLFQIKIKDNSNIRQTKTIDLTRKKNIMTLSSELDESDPRETSYFTGQFV